MKIDRGIYLEKNKIRKIEKDFTKFRPRVEEIAKELCGGNPAMFGISGFTNSGEALLKFTPKMQEAALSKFAL